MAYRSGMRVCGAVEEEEKKQRKTTTNSHTNSSLFLQKMARRISVLH